MKTWLPVPVLFLVFGLSAQSVWQKILPSYKHQQARDIAPAADGNYWVLANYQQGFDDSIQINLLKINLQGDVVDSKYFNKAYGLALQTFADGSLAILAQHVEVNSFHRKAIVIKLDPQGMVQWQTELEDGYANAMIADPAGGYFVGGLFDHTGSVDQSFLSHLSDSGVELWTKKYDIVSLSTIQSLRLIGNELIAVGGTRTIGAGLDGFFLLKVDATSGDQIWQVTQDVGRFKVDQSSLYSFPPLGITEDASGNILIACPGIQGQAGGSGIFRYSTAGVLLQHIQLSSFSYQRFPMDLQTDAAGDLIITGAGGTDTEHLRPFIEKRAANGQILWSHRLAIPGQLTGFTPAPDGGFIACGIDLGLLYGPPNQIIHTLLVRFDSLGNAFPCRIEGFVRRDDNLNCGSDPSDPPLRNWHLQLDDTIHLSTDATGYFRADLPTGDHYLRLLTPTPVYEACDNDFAFTTSLNDPVATANFPVQKGPDCPLLEVGITHTDLMPCDTSVLYLSWQNRGNATASNATLTALLDPQLILLGASQAYTQAGQAFTFPLGNLPADSNGSIQMKVRLACDAPLFSTHVVEARIEPVSYCWTSTPTGWNGPVLKASGECLGDQVAFTVSNEGGALVSPLPYRLYVDAALVETGVLQPQPGQPFTLEYAAAGRTVALQTEQVADYPVRSNPRAEVEACGISPTGLASTGFVRMFACGDAEPWVSKVFIETSSRSTGNRIFEIPQGYGHYHWLEPDTVPLEFSLQMSNSFDQPAEALSLTLLPSAQLDLSTFTLVGWSHPVTYEITNNGEIQVRATGLGLLPGEEFQLRFRLLFRPISADDFVSIASEAYLDGQGPLRPYEAFFNIGENFVANTVTPASDDPDVKIFGRGNAYEFAADFAQTPNGELVQLGSTSIFGEGQSLYMVRSDSTGKGIWQKTYQMGGGSNYPTVMVPLPDNSVLIAGAFEDVTLQDYLDYSYAFIARIAADGTLLWVRSWKPGTGGTVVTAELTPDGNAVFWVLGHTGGNQPWLNSLIKISPDNEIIWEKNYPQFQADRLLGGKLQAGKDGYLYFIGIPDSYLSNIDYRLIRFNWNGEVVDFGGYNNPPDEYPALGDFAPAMDGGLMLTGSQLDYDDATQTYTSSIVLVKLNAQFGVQWRKKHEVAQLSDISAIQAAGGAYFLAGDMFTDTVQVSSLDALLAKVDNAGEVLWLKTFPANAREYSNRLLIGQHERIWMTAQTQTVDNVYNLQMVLYRANDPDALVQTAEAPTAERSITIDPNPASRTIWPRLPAEARATGAWNFEITDAGGKVVRQSDWQPGAGIPVRDLPNGAYVLRLRDVKNGEWLGKFLVQH